jgi:hypothetical protein
VKGIVDSRRVHYRARLCIFLIMIVLTIGAVGCHTHGYPCLEVQTWYDLDAVRNNLNGNHILMNDLDSATAGYEELASPTANGGKGWQPIGTFVIDYSLSFGGLFDGQGYEISDLFINRPDEGDIGLFGSVKQDGLITNIGLVNFTMSGCDRVGGLAGASGGTVSSSHTKGNVTGGEWGIGGLVGGNWGTVTNCYSANNVTGHAAVGGLVGQNDGTVSNSYSTDNVSGQEGVGGVAGVNYFGIVSNSYSSGSVAGGYHVGGLVGANAGNVSDCYSTGGVTGVEDVGGLVGDNFQGNVDRSFWDVQTSGQASSDGGTSRTTAEMKNLTTFSGAYWNIIAVADSGTRNTGYIWNIVDGETYPLLSWEVQAKT